jgi:tetratricopeptide (TPR) repeat protein
MDGEELVSFEKRLKKDKILQEQVEEHRILIKGVEEQSFLNKLEEFHTDINAVKTIAEPSKKQLSFTKYAIAASIALLIGFGGYWIFNSSNSNQRLYTKYFKPDPGLPTVMGTTDNYDFYAAMVNYKRGDYKLAIEKWEKLLEVKPDNDTLNYFLGVAHLANKNGGKSIDYLEKVIKDQNTSFKEDAYYYLGFAYLKEGNIDLAKESFTHSTLYNSKDILSKLDN